MEKTAQSILEILPERAARAYAAADYELKRNVFEIRLRAESAVSISYMDKNKYLKEDGTLTEHEDEALRVSAAEIEECMLKMSNYSLYSIQNQIKDGFITIKGGHRVGICGSAVLENGAVKSVKNITSLNFRIARDISGAALKIYNLVFRENIESAIIAGKPSCGKTTVLRDLARCFSKSGKRVGVVDERGELAACFEGIPQNKLGGLTDVLNGYPKAHGITQAVRSLSPQVLICDEIGDREDMLSLEQSFKFGVPVVATLHASGMADIRGRAFIRELIKTGYVKNIILLAGPEKIGQIDEIISAGDLIA